MRIYNPEYLPAGTPTGRVEYGWRARRQLQRALASILKSKKKSITQGLFQAKTFVA